MDFLQTLDDYLFHKNLPPDVAQNIRDFSYSYFRVIQENHGDLAAAEDMLKRYLKYAHEQSNSPHQFSCYHEVLRSPVDYFQFNLDFFIPLISKDKSVINHSHRVDEIEAQLARGENVILLSNHQVEPDPQAIIVMLLDKHPELAENMIFVAGHRVTTDPLAIPFSLGLNLLCIYSKKHIDLIPELKEERQLHNRRTMNAMRELLAEGGKCIFVAPSGGRDRADASGKIVLSPFDPQSIEMFRLIAKQAKRPTHFYPLALSTDRLMPTPAKLTTSLIEPRTVNFTPVKLGFGEELPLDDMPGLEGLDKHECRDARAKAVWDSVNREYQSF
jgi:glycerol-3-phosphate O-acyltransferase